MQHTLGDICVYASFSHFRLAESDAGILEFIAFAMSLANTLNTPLNFVSHQYTVKNRHNDVVKTQHLTPGAMLRLRKKITERSTQAISFYSTGDTGMEKPLAYMTLYMDSREVGCKYVFLEFDAKKLAEHITSPHELAKMIFQQMDRFIDVQYALLTTMLSSKYPSLYFAGIYTPELNDVEKLNLATWEENQKAHAAKLRGLYDGNLLCAGHLQIISDYPEFKNKMRSLIGVENISEVVPGKLYVSLPVSRKVRAQVYAMFDENHLLMKPSKYAIEIAQMI